MTEPKNVLLSMHTRTAISVDDEQAAHYAFRNLLKGYHGIELIGQAHNGTEAVELINNLKPEIVFLDIQMPDMNGFEVLKHLTYQPYIVFCTAYDQYAIEAFNQNSIDYLLKPMDDKRFAQCVGKIEKFIPKHQEIDVSKLMDLSRMLNPPRKAFAIPITVRSKITFVPCDKISFCNARDGYVSLITDDGTEHVCDLTLKQLEERLPDDFLRVQKSYIVNKTKIETVEKHFNNRLVLTMGDYSRTKITTGTSYISVIRRELLL